MGKKNEGRAAIVAGLRTPFGRRDGVFRHLSALDLGRLCVAELVQRSGVDPLRIEQVVFGQGAPTPAVPNIAREVVLGAGLPPGLDAATVSCGDATGYRALAYAVEGIRAGTIACAVVGGADSASDVPVVVSRRLAEALRIAGGARSIAERLQALAELRPRDLLPAPAAPRELSTGQSLGEAAEKMAKENGISREAQDELAHRSHVRAVRAWAEGRLDDEVMPVYVPPDFQSAREDEHPRRDSSLDDLAALPPVHDERHGTITAGTSAPPADGASALLVMREEYARALGHAPLGYVRSHAFAGVDPRRQLLLGPAYATPLALDRAGVALADLDLVDVHEAFAAQALSVVQAFESETFARRELGRDHRLGAVDWDRFNVDGGALALGDPFAATGGRQIAHTLRELKRRGGGLALCTACAAGGLGAAIVLEVE
jgi:acetyl-CoA acyltransferase